MMPGSGTRTFLDPDRYEASLRHQLIEAVITPCGAFKCRMICAQLHHVQLLRCEEEFPRIAFLSLAVRPLFVTFPIGSGPLPVWDGTQLQTGDIFFHRLGDRFHQAMLGPCVWAAIAMDPLELDKHVRALYQTPLPPPSASKILRPTRREAARLRRLHAQICRLADTKPKILTHPEVARALEQDLMHALAKCLIAAEVSDEGSFKQSPAAMLVDFEEAISDHLSQPITVSKYCDLLGVTERSLRTVCADFIGINPRRYILMRRLRQVRSALCAADPVTANVADLARAGGFREPGRFAVAYQAIFGETPSVTLARAPETNFLSP